MRRASRKDSTHQPIERALQALGWTTHDTSRLGENFPDMIAAKRGITILVECKTGKRKLSEGQQEFYQTWNGKVYVARSIDDVLTINHQAMEGV